MVPAVQFVQLADFAEAAKEPATHTVHPDAAVSDTVPAEQLRHADEPCSLANIPASQSVQFDSPSNGAKLPESQSSHWNACMTPATVPAEQFTQAAAWTDAANIPLAHIVHSVSPSPGPNWPSSQSTQGKEQIPNRLHELDLETSS
jgi:hypothetical protein